PLAFEREVRRAWFARHRRRGRGWNLRRSGRDDPGAAVCLGRSLGGVLLGNQHRAERRCSRGGLAGPAAKGQRERPLLTRVARDEAAAVLARRARREGHRYRQALPRVDAEAAQATGELALGV